MSYSIGRESIAIGEASFSHLSDKLILRSTLLYIAPRPIICVHAYAYGIISCNLRAFSFVKRSYRAG